MTPYNTYMIEGLPPTPIAMVSEGALQAVAHPAKQIFIILLQMEVAVINLPAI